MGYAKITEDHLWKEGDVSPSRIGWSLGDEQERPTEGVLQVRLLDDDRELYYTAEATDDALETLHSWAGIDAGVTILQVLKGDVWEDVIA
jgi:hypothetical protein